MGIEVDNEGNVLWDKDDNIPTSKETVENEKINKELPKDNTVDLMFKGSLILGFFGIAWVLINILVFHL